MRHYIHFFLNRKLATLLDVKPSGSRIEVVSGKDGTPYLTLGNSTNKAELACKIMGLDLSMSTIFLNHFQCNVAI